MTEKNFYEFDTGNGVKHYFKKDLNDSDKYVVCTCAKNENDYIIEFIEHYINLGFDKIFKIVSSFVPRRVSHISLL